WRSGEGGGRSCDGLFAQVRRDSRQNIRGRREEPELPLAWHEGERQSTTKDEAVGAEEPAAIHIGDAIHDPGSADDAAEGHVLLADQFAVLVVFLASVDQEPAASAR